MGTRSLTGFYNEDGRVLAVLYRQFDGYPAGHGADLAGLLKQAQMVNGISGSSPDIFNGAGDLAVRVITALKAESGGAGSPGGFYLRPPEELSERDGWEEYRYHVRPETAGGGVRLQVESGYRSKAATSQSGTLSTMAQSARLTLTPLSQTTRMSLMIDDARHALILLSFGGGFALAVMLLSALGVGGAG